MPRRRLLLASALALLSAGADWPGDAEDLARAFAQAPAPRRVEIVAEAAAARDAEGDALLTHALEDPAAEVVLAALEHVARGRVRAAVTRVTALLSDERVAVRAAAAGAAGAIGDGRAVSALARAAGDSDAAVRQRAIEALAAVGGDGATLAIIDRVNDAESAVRVVAVRTLGALGDPRAVLSVLGTLEDPNPDVRVAAAQALGRLRDARAVRALRAALGDDAAEVRIAATRALGALGPDAAESIDDLAAEAHREDRTLDAAARGPLARAAIDALATIGTARAVELLVRVVREGPEEDVRAAVDALARAPRDARARAGATLLPLPERASDPMIELLGELGGEGPATALLDLLDARGAAPERRRRLLVALGRSGDPRAVRRLLRASAEATDTPIPLRRNASCDVSPSFAGALAGLQAYLGRAGALPAVAIDPLAEMIHRPPPSCVDAVASLIDLVGATENPRAGEVLAPYLTHAVAPLRAAALRALARIDASDARAARGGLADPSPEVRLAAADLLARRGAREDFDALLSAVRSPAPMDRATALGALATIAARVGEMASLVPTLAHLARDASPTVSAAAVDALATLGAAGEATALPPLREALAHGDASRHRVAVEALGNALAGAAPSSRASLSAALPVAVGADPTTAWALRAHSDALPRLRALLDDPRRAVASNAAAALAQRFSGDRALALPEAAPLCARWPTTEDEALRANLARALILGGAPCAEDLAARAMRADESSLVRRAVASAIATRGDASAPSALARCAAGDASAAVAAHCARLRDGGPLASGARVDASARGADDEPLESATVRVALADGAVVWAVTGPGGWIRLRGVAAGPFTLQR